MKAGRGAGGAGGRTPSIQPRRSNNTCLQATPAGHHAPYAGIAAGRQRWHAGALLVARRALGCHRRRRCLLLPPPLLLLLRPALPLANRGALGLQQGPQHLAAIVLGAGGGAGGCGGRSSSSSGSSSRKNVSNGIVGQFGSGSPGPIRAHLPTCNSQQLIFQQRQRPAGVTLLPVVLLLMLLLLLLLLWLLLLLILVHRCVDAGSGTLPPNLQPRSPKPEGPSNGGRCALGCVGRRLLLPLLLSKRHSCCRGAVLPCIAPCGPDLRG